LFSFISLFGFDISYLLVISTAGRILNQSQHLNIQTPYWLGFVLQRPEQHRLHHAPNAYCNYGLIPLWDIIFGTFKNTREEVDLGFSEEAQTKFAEMLSFKKIS
jgi:sterol desaturase/sphingolipid hydroxylase (fatty acid hydroxylase superfamily)